jgi:hypothetical protein
MMVWQVSMITARRAEGEQVERSLEKGNGSSKRELKNIFNTGLARKLFFLGWLTRPKSTPSEYVC